MNMRAVSLSSVLLGLLLILPVAQAGAADSGSFRGKWWNYYDRALEQAEKGALKDAASDLRDALSRRDKDQRMARTYGMHFIDYFPHRELGIVYLRTGDIDKAIGELETSMKQEESAKAAFYLNKARKEKMLKDRGAKYGAPTLGITAPRDGTVIRDLSVAVKGAAKGDALVARVTVDKSHVLFDLARGQVDFEKSVPLTDGENRITVLAEDLLGNVVRKEVTVTVDREGPSINIESVTAETRDGRRVVRIKGEADDPSGLRKIAINGKAVDTGGRKVHAFDLPVDTAVGGGTVSIQAFDVLDNETRADIDLKKELAAFSRRPATVLLALNAAGILSFDKEPPAIALKGSSDVPPVFLDRYYVEGEAFDNDKVEKVTVNGREISTKRGKKVFFSKIIQLAEGKNTITVEAFDGAGNKASTEFAVTRVVPAVLATSSRMSVSVLPFEIKQQESAVSSLAYDYLIGSFTEQKRFSVVERTKLEQILVEQKLTKAKLTDPEHSIKVGKLMSADTILATSLREDQKSVEIISRVISTETSQVLEVKDVYSEEKGPSVVKELMDGLAAKIAVSFPLAEGIVIKADGGTIYSDIGVKSRLKKDAAVIVYRKGPEIKHPITGKSLGFDTVRLGEGRIEDIQEDFSKVKLVSKPQQEIKVADQIIVR